MAETHIPQRTDLQLPDLHHIGMVVRDRDATIRQYKDVLGISPFVSFDTQFAHTYVHGKLTPFGLRIGFAWLGNTLLELLQPLDHASPHFHFLEEHGEGIHHLAFLVPNLEDTLAKMQEKGLSLLVHSKPPTGDSWAYLEGNVASGAIFEVIQDTPTVRTAFTQIYQATGRKDLPW